MARKDSIIYPILSSQTILEKRERYSGWVDGCGREREGEDNNQGNKRDQNLPAIRPPTNPALPLTRNAISQPPEREQRPSSRADRKIP